MGKLDNCMAELLGTEDWVIAEATSNDRNWGIGLDRGDSRVRNPRQWQGTNMLGWALMEARKALLAPEAVAAELPASEVPNVSDEPAPSKLTEPEKKLLKSAKKVREVLKLQEACDRGETLDKMQAKKLEGKDDMLLELARIERDLPLESELRAKNKDVLAHLRL